MDLAKRRPSSIGDTQTTVVTRLDEVGQNGDDPQNDGVTIEVLCVDGRQRLNDVGGEEEGMEGG